MSNKSKILLSSIIVLFAISSIFVALFNSQYLNIRVIEVSVDRGEVPPSVINYLKIYENENIFRINTNSLKQALENNPFIESAKIKITVSKKMTINLIKTKVNAIIKVIEKDAFALLSEEGLFLIEKEDLSIVDTQLIVIEMKQHLLNSLLINEYLGKFSILVGNLDLLNDSYYLISSVKYDNNVNNGFGFFKLELANTNTVIRVRQRVNTQLLEKAIDLAQEKRVNDQSITVLDVYHGAIIERSRPFGG